MTTDARHHSHPTVALTGELVSRASITPDDAGCQALLIERLNLLGFTCETIVCGKVTNLWAKRGSQSPLFVFAGHTDVVPPGDASRWRFDPFVPTIDEDEKLYGRGSADMKGGVAAFVVALTCFLEANPTHSGSIGLIITSDEEGDAVDGTVKVVDALVSRGEKIDYCLVGEPTSEQQLGDAIKVGRRGSLCGQLTVHGKQGHIAYPHLADNPIHKAMPALTQLTQTQWDEGNDYFPATSFQISNIRSGLGVGNVIPPDIHITFNFRFSTASTENSLKNRVKDILNSHKLSYDLKWTLSGHPWINSHTTLVESAEQAVQSITGRIPKRSTGGGISDARFIAPTGAEVIELGPLNATIHKIDECVAIDELTQLTDIYEHILHQLLTA